MIRYLPQIYENELLSSWLSRAYSHSPYISSASFRHTIIDKPTVSIDWLFYNEYSKDFKKLLNEKYGFKNLIEKHTLVPFYSSFFLSKQKKEVLHKAMNCEPCITHFLSYPTTHMRTIKYCPKCISEHREPYFALEPQIIGMNYCPIHKCKYRSTNILLDREKLLEFKSMDLIDFDLSPIEQSEEDNINIKVARYIYEFLHTAPNYDNDIPIGLFLRSKLEGTEYMSTRGKQIKNLNQLLSDITEFYKDLEYFELSRWRLCHILMGSYINVYDILLIAYFLHISIQDLINPSLPQKSQLEQFDLTVNEMFMNGMNYMDIARTLKTDKEVIRQVILGKYIKQNL